MDDFINLVKCKLKIDIVADQICQAYRMGKSNGKNRPLFVSVINFKVKMDIMSKVNVLKGSKISICHDLTTKARDIKKLLMKRASEIRAKGLNVKVRQRSLLVENTEISYEKLNKKDWTMHIKDFRKRQRNDSGSSDDNSTGNKSGPQGNSQTMFQNPHTSHSENSQNPLLTQLEGTHRNRSSSRTKSKKPNLGV